MIQHSSEVFFKLLQFASSTYDCEITVICESFCFPHQRAKFLSSQRTIRYFSTVKFTPTGNNQQSCQLLTIRVYISRQVLERRFTRWTTNSFAPDGRCSSISLDGFFRIYVDYAVRKFSHHSTRATLRRRIVLDFESQ